MPDAQTLGNIIGSSQITQMQSQSNQLCTCGRPKKVVGQVRYPWCDECLAERAEQERQEAVLKCQLAAEQELLRIRQGHRDKAITLRAKLSQVIPPLFAQAHLRDLSLKLREIMLDLPDGKGLFLFGPAGVGKSHAMAALMRKFIIAGLCVQRVQWDRLCLEIRNTFNSNRSELSVLDPYCDCDKLLIEDIGTTVSINSQESDFNLKTLLLILDDRLEHCKATFITSNKNSEQLGNAFDSRIESRLHASCVIRAVSGEDRRKIKSEKPEKS